VNGTSDDFCLDGQKLVAAGDGTYRTLIETFQRVTPSDGTNNPDHFTVRTKSGLTLTYGGVSNGATYSEFGKSTIHLWLLQEVQDTAGNYMVFSYTTQPSTSDSVCTVEPFAYYPDTIKYTGNVAGGVSPFVTVKFNYQTRGAQFNTCSNVVIPRGSSGGAFFEWDALLSSITVSAGGSQVRSWALSYGATQPWSGSFYRRSILQSVQEAGSDGVSLPPTKFSLTNVNAGTSGNNNNLYTTSVTTTSTHDFFPANLYNNGHTQIISVNAGGGGADVSIFDPHSGTATAPTQWSIPAGDAEPMVGDFDGDGYSDLAIVTDNNGCGFTVTYALGDRNGGLGSLKKFYVTPMQQQLLCSQGTNIITSAQPAAAATSPPVINCASVSCSALNVAPPVPACANGVCPNSLGWNLPQAIVPNAGGCSSQPKDYLIHVFVGDFDGDGRQDLLLQYTEVQYCISTPLQRVIFSIGGSFTAGNIQYSSHDSTWTMLVGDINGDGVSDVVWVGPAQGSGKNQYPVETCLNDGPCVSQGTQTLSVSGAVYSPALADMNGDGSQDLVFFSEIEGSTSNTAVWVNILYSDGLGNYDAPVPLQISEPPAFLLPTKDAYTPVIGDFDGDGFNDLGFVSTGTKTATTEVYGNNGAGQFSINGNAGTSLTASANVTTAVPADVNGTGQLGIVALAPSSTTQMGVATFKGPGLQRLTQVTNGYGATIGLTWKALTDTTVYDGSQDNNTSAFPYSHASGDTSGALWAFPNHPFHEALYVLSSQTASGGGTSRTVTYKYAGARVNVQGRGFLGFAETTAADNATGMTSATDIRQDFPYTGMTSHTLAKVTSSGLVADESFATYSLVSTNTPSNYPVASETIDQRHEIDVSGDPIVTSVKTDSSFNQYGELTSNTVTTYAGDVTAGAKFVTHTSNTYNKDNVSAWLLGRMDSTTVTRTNPDNTSDTRYSTFDYDATTGLLKMEKIWGRSSSDTTHWTETDYARDTFGNIKTTTVSGSGIATRATNNTYPPGAPYYGRFSTSTCNPLNQCMGRNYDAAGDLLSQTDPNGVVTNFSIDGFGRSTGSSITQTAAGGLNVSTTITRALCSASGNLCNAVPNGYFYVESSQSDGSGSVAVYDTAERVVRKATLNGDGGWIETLTQYDAASRPVKVSAPHRGTDTVYWTTTTYDPLGRPTQVLTYSDQNTTETIQHAYGIDSSTNDAKTTVTDGRGLKTTQLTDSIGRLYESIDNNGNVVSYGYDPFDNLTSITDPSGHKTTAVYDSRGHKTQMTDPDMGTWTYVPDVLGEITQQTDAKGNVISMTYDLLGRMTSRTEAEDTTTWTYDTLWKGALYQAKVMSGATQKYLRTLSNPTPFGAMKTQATVIDGTTYTFTYAYDNQGRVSQITYPQNISVKPAYNAYGAEYQLTDATSGAIYWKATAWDNWGKVSDETYKNTVSTGTYRDLAVGRISAIIGGVGAGSGVIDLAYQWDADGNTAMREDYNQSNRIEYFCYTDGLNRLNSVQTQSCSGGTGGQILAIGYNALGNITSKTGIGSYTYTGTGPHAVSTAGSNSYTYDADGNLSQVKLSGSPIRTYTWSSYNLPTALTNSSTGAGSMFEYGPDREKVRQTSTQSGSSTTIDSVGGGLFEAVSTSAGISYNNYLVAPTGVIGLITQSSGSSDAIAYFHHDALGSVAVVTDAGGGVVQRTWYDAFGVQSVVSGSLRTPWGYTGALELSDVGLVHMNGRVYDPVIGRFLSPDPNVQAPGNLQSLNRYSYVWNNPLSYTDPSGYFLSGFFHWLGHHWQPFAEIAVMIACDAYCGPVLGLTADESAMAGGFAAGLIGGNGDLLSGFEGADLALFDYAIGQSLGDPAVSGVLDGSQTEVYVEKVVAHGIVGGMQAGFAGDKIGAGFLAGAAQSAAAPGIDAIGSSGGLGIEAARITAVAVIGGTASVLGGGKFANGAVTAAFAQAFNDELSRQHGYGSDGKPIINERPPGAPATLIKDANGDWIWVATADAGMAVFSAQTGSTIGGNECNRCELMATAAGLAWLAAGSDTLGVFSLLAGGYDIASVYFSAGFLFDAMSFGLHPTQEGAIGLGMDVLPGPTGFLLGRPGEGFASSMGWLWTVGSAANSSCQIPERCQ